MENIYGNISIIIASLIGFIGVYLTAKSSVKQALSSKEKQHQIDIELKNREKKLEVYQKCFDFIRLLLKNNPNLKKAQEKGEEAYSECMLYASDELILKILKLRTSKDYKKSLFAVEDIFFQMRKELGLSNKHLKKGDLIKIILKDPGQLDEFMQ